ncbi:SMC family ATPase, partial [Candidatus Woesearchaeota archaeon]|nr:SMC family ATPase [Candidatus Woesearchaeota archaeon]
MIIKSVILKNIRSYLDEKINFPSGSVLLSGDIGSGKSTVLLGIEFVLFGFERKHLSGSTLLRNGEKEGSVEVNFEIDGKDVVIKRVLKRTKDSIKQEAGYIIIDKTKKELTPVELRAFVLNLLGYPKELLTKSKDIIYKYTVYTPQEEMKQILVEDKDVRLETLRKVFQIDKYKRIRENSVIFIREIKEMKREYEGIATNLDEKKQQLKEREHESEELGIKLDETTKIIIKIREENEKRKQNMLKYEKKIKLFDELKNNLERKEPELQHKLENRKKNNNELTELDKKSEELEKELKNIDIGDIKEISGKMESKKNQIELMEKTISEIRNKINEFNINIKNADDIKR